MKGWYGKSQQHGLASRGISSKTIKDVIQFPEVLDYNSSSEIIVGFWISSIKHDFSKFDFDKAFKTFEEQLTNYIQMASDGITEEEIREVYFNDEDDLMDLTMEYGIGSEVFNAIDLKDRIRDRDRYNLQSNIVLFDDVVHTEHQSGGVLWDNTEMWWIDIEKLRYNFDLVTKKLGVEYDKRLVW